MELINGQFLVANSAFYQISHRNDADYFFSFDDWQMAHMPLCHQRHAFFDGLFRPYGDNASLHDLPNRR